MLLAFISLFASTSNGAQYKATFTTQGSGVVGTVIINNQFLMVDIDLTNTPTAQVATDCYSTDGLNYHMHYWIPTNRTEGIGGGNDGCGAGPTKLHYDPFARCGGASNNEYCAPKTGNDADAVNPTCVLRSTYATGCGVVTPYGCEVGDFSSKYGNVMIDSSTKKGYVNVSSPYEVDNAILGKMAYSVVFHCGTGSLKGNRVFCSKFELDNSVATNTKPTQVGMSSNTVVKATFTDFGADNYVSFKNTGEVKIMLNSGSTTLTSIQDCSSSGYNIAIYNSFGTGTSALGSNCAVGNQYDPTNQCYGMYSSSAYCVKGKVCNATGYSYSCGNIKMECSPADLTGKFSATFRPGQALSITATDSSMPIDMLVGKSVGIYCPDSMGSRGRDASVIACAKFIGDEKPQDDGRSSLYVTIFGILNVFVIVLLM